MARLDLALDPDVPTVKPMAKISGGSSPGHPVWCRGTRADGKPCGRKVTISGALCYWHKERARKRARELSRARRDDNHDGG